MHTRRVAAFTTSRRKVLVIDDDPAVTDYLQLKLQSRYAVVTLNDSRQALATVRKERPDLVVCDIDMPEMDGPAVCEALHAAGDTCDVAFLYLTSTVDRYDVAGTGGVVLGRQGLSKHAPIAQIVLRIDAAIEAAATARS
jgi:putative two-component system response regulator